MGVCHHEAPRTFAALALFILTYCVMASYTEVGLGDAFRVHLGPGGRSVALGPAGMVSSPGARAGLMRVVVVHNRYRSAAPSGENRVADQESAALEAHGHEVERFERLSDDIGTWSPLRRSLVPSSDLER